MASMTWIISSVLLMGTLSAYAKKTPADCKQPTDIEEQVEHILKVTGSVPDHGCADASKLKGICVYLYQRTDAPDDSDYDYHYEKQINDAACVKASDSESVASAKIRRMWSKLENDYLTCDQANFDVSRGSILKYSVAMRNWDFINSAADIWEVNLNRVDPSDNRTLLDYIEKEIQRTKSDPAFNGTLKSYYKLLRNKGAKHRREL